MKKATKKTNKRLGRGVSALLKVNSFEESQSRKPEKVKLKSPKDSVKTNAVLEVEVGSVFPNEEQPRKKFNEKDLAELTESIRVQGIMQPIVAVKKSKGFEIVAGERRWRAAKKAGLKKVPIIVHEIDEQKKLEWSIIENVQRSDLNPIEEGEAYKLLAQKYKLKQKDIAERVGKDRATVANVMRITQAEKYVKDLVVEGTISLGHAKVLVSVEEPKLQKSLAEKVVRLNLSVRATESMIKKALTPEVEILEKKSDLTSQYKSIEVQLLKKLGTKVKINEKSGKGRLEINFQNLAQFNEIIEHILN